MLLQTNSYIVPKDKRAEHARLLRRFRATLAKLGCDSFEVYEQVGSNWSTGEPTGRYVQIMRFRDRRHQLAVQAAERSDPAAQAIIAEFCQLINFPYQQQQGLFAVGFYHSVLPAAPTRPQPTAAEGAEADGAAGAAAGAAVAEEAAAEAAHDEVTEPGAEDTTDEAPGDEGAEPIAEADGRVSAEDEAGAETAPPEEADAIAADEAAPPEPESPAAPVEDNGEELSSASSDVSPAPAEPDETGTPLDAHADVERSNGEAVGDHEHRAPPEAGAHDEEPEGLDTLDIDLPDDAADHANSHHPHVAR
jgi:hypothetical protein